MDAWWKRKIERKKRVGHQTEGKIKCETCQASTLDRYMAKTSRSYKHPLYGNWLEKTRIKR